MQIKESSEFPGVFVLLILLTYIEIKGFIAGIISSGVVCKYFYLATTLYTDFELRGDLHLSKINPGTQSPASFIYGSAAEVDIEICFLEKT